MQVTRIRITRTHFELRCGNILAGCPAMLSSEPIIEDPDDHTKSYDAHTAARRELETAAQKRGWTELPVPGHSGTTIPICPACSKVLAAAANRHAEPGE